LLLRDPQQRRLSVQRQRDSEFGKHGLGALAGRAFVEHRPTTPWKVWYVAPHFRYERPQKGRFREFHQLDAEIIGAAEELSASRPAYSASMAR